MSEEKIASFEQIRNDLFWRFYDWRKQEYIKWSGYDDTYWWTHVAVKDTWKTRGRYTLNPRTNVVTVRDES